MRPPIYVKLIIRKVFDAAETHWLATGVIFEKNFLSNPFCNLKREPKCKMILVKYSPRNGLSVEEVTSYILYYVQIVNNPNTSCLSEFMELSQKSR